MARESVQELIVRIKQEGLGNLEFLKKELKQVSSQSKISEGSINKLQKEISKFGAATKNSVEGIKGQVSAFQKLRAQSDFQGRAYKSLTKDIISLNRELKTRLGIEKELDAGRGVRRGRFSAGAGDRGLLESRMDKNLGGGTRDDYARRAASLQALLVTRTFDNLAKEQQKFLEDFSRNPFTQKGTIRSVTGGSAEFQKLIKESNSRFLATSQYGTGGKLLGGGTHTFGADQLQQLGETGKLNSLQRAALNIQEDLNIASKKYAEVLAKVNAEEGVQSRILSAQDAVAKNQVANIRAKTIARDDQIAQQRTRVKSFLQQQQFDPIAGSLGGTIGATYFGGQQFPGPASRDFAAKSPRAQQFQSTLAMLGIKTPTYAAAEKEYRQSISGYEASTQADKTRIRMPKFGDFARGVSDTEIDTILGKRSLFGFKEPKLSRIDPMGLGKDLAYPKTDTGFAAELNNLNELLPNLKRGSKEWVDTTLKIEKKQQELAETIKEGNEALKKRREAIAKEVNPKVNQKLLPPGKPTLEEAMGGVKGQKFDARKISKGMKNTSKSVDDLRRSILKKTSASNKSINKLNEQRNSLDKLRNSVAPNSSAFKQLTKDIDRTNQSLSKLQGRSKGFGKKGLLGFGQSVLGGAYFGGPFGAVGAGIGQMFGGQSGAATGGLVGAQVGRPITEFIGGSTDYAAQYSKAQLTLQQITKDSGSYGVAMDAVKTAVEEFNVPQEVAIKGMTRLSAAVLGSGGNINNAAEAFLNTTAAIKGTAGSADDVKSAITAMVQIYSKGKVSAEELSGQLGERFPGAVTKFAKANNISTQSLQKNLKDGTVGLDMLSKFIESLGSEYIPLAKKIAASNEEAGARSRVAMNRLRIAVGEELIPIGKEFQEMTAELLIDLIPALTKLAEIGGDAFAALASSISFVVDNFNIIGPAIAGATASLVAYNIQQQITNRTGIAKILIQAWAAMTKLVAAIKAGTVAQAALNAVTAINPYVALAGVITSVATAIWGVKAASDALKGEETLLGDISGMTLKETEKQLEAVKNTIKTYQDIINNPDTAEETKKGLSSLLDKLENSVSRLQTQITKLGGKVVFDPMTKGAEDAGEKIYKGLSGGVKKFMDDMKNAGEEFANVTASWFDRMASSLADFVMTGKLKFKEFARSVIADLAKMIMKQMIFNMIAGLGKWGSLVADRRLSGLGKGSALNTPVGSPNFPKGANGLVVAKNGIVPYAKGGIVDSPTLFPFSRGVGLMGEKGPEAIVPLKRGRDGKLGIAGGGGSTVVNVSVDATGTKARGNGMQAKQLGKLVGTAVEAELIKQKRPGGILYG
tara:strand:- start:3706 stop:7662 length:3957 start_codon:yes stop_codon:yes gene_type:complete